MMLTKVMQLSCRNPEINDETEKSPAKDRIEQNLSHEGADNKNDTYRNE